jgi:glycosyltransferase involved in cell wall biosynthesis
VTPEPEQAPLVEVLMSTHDGAAHLREQVDSILGQQGVRVRLFVRDDGSRDETLQILTEYARDERVHVVRGEKLGLPHAFFQLVQDSREDADLWALADQDDVWMPMKLVRAARALAGHHEPALACARVLVTDGQLEPLYRHALPVRGPSFGNALVQNVATGCTIVINRAGRAVLRDRWPADAVMHDAWLYLVLSATGTVLYDPEVVVQYRQHGANAVGVGRGPASRVAGRVRRQLRAGGSGAHGRQNAELRRTHADVLPDNALHLLDEFLAARESLARRARFALSGGAHRQSRGSDLVYRVLMLAGRV